MGHYWLHDIGTALAGLPVNFYGGWETRSRSSGGFDDILAVAIHHTASQTSPDSDMNYMWSGSPDRPVGNIYLSRAGDIWVGAAGASNTQGKGGPLNCSHDTVPKDAGNKFMIAIEAANNGAGEAWPQVQVDSYVALVHALCAHYGLKVDQDVYGHFDYCAPSCPGRKIDPAGPSPFGSVNSSGTWDINAFRRAVANISGGSGIDTDGDDELNQDQANELHAAYQFSDWSWQKIQEIDTMIDEYMWPYIQAIEERCEWMQNAMIHNGIVIPEGQAVKSDKPKRSD